VSILVKPRIRRTEKDGAVQRRLSSDLDDSTAPRSFSGRVHSEAEIREGYLEIADRLDRLAEAANILHTGLLGIKPTPNLGPHLPSVVVFGGLAKATEEFASYAAQKMRAEALRDLDRFRADLHGRVERDKSDGYREGRQRAERIERATRFNGAC
jgi:hypothetical protein